MDFEAVSFSLPPPIRDPKMMIATAAKPTRSESVSKTESGVSQQKTVQQQPRVRRRVTPVLATTGCPIDQARKFLKAKGLSPKGTVTEYCDPKDVKKATIGTTSAKRRAAAIVANPLSQRLVFSDDNDAPSRRQISITSSGLGIRIPPPSPKRNNSPATTVTTTAKHHDASPSVARSKVLLDDEITIEEEEEESSSSSINADDDDSSSGESAISSVGVDVVEEADDSSLKKSSVAKPPAPPTRHVSLPLGQIPSVELASAGFLPFRCIKLAQNGDEIVLAVTPYKDRIGIYYPREVAVPLRTVGRMFEGVPIDIVTEELVTTIEQADAEGLGHLADATGACADAFEAKFDSLVLGALSASVSSLEEEEIEVPRYFVALHRKNEAPLFFFAHGCEGGVHKIAKFARSVGTAPVVHRDMFSFDRAAEVATYIRKRVEEAEQKQLEETLTGAIETIETQCAETLKAIKLLKQSASRTLRLKEREAKSIVEQIEARGRGAIAGRREAYRLSELGSFASRVEEVIGTAVSSAAAAASDLDTAFRTAAAECFVETQTVFANATFKPLKGSEWGLAKDEEDDSRLASIDFRSISKHLKLPNELSNGAANTQALRRVGAAAEHAIDIRRHGWV
jgi:hypothetical protein